MDVTSCTCIDEYSGLTKEQFWEDCEYDMENQLLYYWVFYGHNESMFCHCRDPFQKILEEVPSDEFFDWYSSTEGHMYS